MKWAEDLIGSHLMRLSVVGLIKSTRHGAVMYRKHKCNPDQLLHHRGRAAIVEVENDA